MQKRLFTLLFISILSFFDIIAYGVPPSLKIEKVIYNENIAFPYVVSEKPEMNKIADVINIRLQNILFGGDEIIDTNNLDLIKEYVFIQNDTIDQSGISQLEYTYIFYPRFLEIVINMDWAGGPYPVGASTDRLYFELQTGEAIVLPDLIDATKYFNFLQLYWLNECGNSIRESHQCAHGNETDDYESTAAYTLDGPCEFQCHKINNNFILSIDSIQIRNNPNCFPHVSQNCNSGSSKYLKVALIKPYLSDFGKWLFGLENTYKPIMEAFHFVGKLDDKYKISMTLISSNSNVVKGTYFYWSQNKKISIEGEIITNKLYLGEYTNDSLNGRFELEWDNFLYSTDGFWINVKTGKKLKAELMGIYDYRDRSYYR
ncbi:MAG: hypothetical protein H7259_06025 [Cytophagales bacterium]|nr:hypothetical protein [Cytophaga sp.]